MVERLKRTVGCEEACQPRSTMLEFCCWGNLLVLVECRPFAGAGIGRKHDEPTLKADLKEREKQYVSNNDLHAAADGGITFWFRRLRARRHRKNCRHCERQQWRRH